MDIFNHGDYGENSNTQKSQSEYLLKLSEDFVNQPDRILDIGCGEGILTNTFSNRYSEAHIIGIDSSSEQIREARKNYPGIEFIVGNFPKTSPDGSFELIVSNCAMHWIDKQELAYREIDKILSETGVGVIHQGHVGCYSELKEKARDVAISMGYDNMDEWNYPINYHTKDSIEELVTSVGLNLEFCEVVEDNLPDSIYEDYANAGLLNFKDVIDDSDWEKFRKRYLEASKKDLDVSSINSDRLYFVVSKG